MKKELKKVFRTTVSILFWVLVWIILSYSVNNEFLLPSPAEVIAALGELLLSSEFWVISLNSLGRILCGIILAVILGIVISIITTRFSLVEVLISPIMSAVKSVPVASFIILTMIWLERDILPVFITLLIVLPIVWTNMSSAIRAVNKDLLEVSKVYKFSTDKILKKLYIPSVMPYFLAACRSALGMAWKAGVAAEVLCTPKLAIGTELYFSKTYMEMPKMFAWTLVIILLSIIIEKVLIYIISRFSLKFNNKTEVKI